jgi:hypothetical protein
MMSLQELQKLREERGLKIFNSNRNSIRSVDGSSYRVLSQSGNGSYTVSKVNSGFRFSRE